MVPLDVMSKSPLFEIAVGCSVQRFIFKIEFIKLLAPVIYGIPLLLLLYLSGDKSVPDIRIIISLSLHHTQLSGISNGKSSVISLTSEPTFS